ncbi:MAG TPA: hypothetical protein VE820_04070 [Sphingomicrobium sp.]|nr:hypothetical protein [Sphingomicrobium sp.]
MSAPLLPTPWMYGRRRLTRVEIAAYAVLIAAALVVFSKFVLDYMEMAERTAMEMTVSNVTSALNIYFATHVMAGEQPASGDWTKKNPFELAHTFPAGYLGELGQRDPAMVERPAWFFDAANAELLYLPRLHGHLSSAREGELRFRLQPRGSGFGFVLVPASPYEWSAGVLAKNSRIAFTMRRTSLFS